MRYERAVRELEFLKSRLEAQTIHESEKLMVVKKQLEKKVMVVKKYRKCSYLSRTLTYAAAPTYAAPRG